MKRLLLAILLITSTVLGAEIVKHSDPEIIKRGDAIQPEMPRVALADVLAKPSEFTKEPIVTEGVVGKVCWIMGCWMNVAPAAGEAGIHVTFKNGAFVVPRSSGGQRVLLLGRVKMTKDKASFVASGVEFLPASER